MTASLTKVSLASEEIEALVRASFGAAARVARCRLAQGGMYNAGYHLDLKGAGPAQAFLKVAPPDDLACLTHERGLLRAEIETLNLVAAAGVGRAPAVLTADLSHRIVRRDVAFLEHLPGALLSETQTGPAGGLRREIGAIAGAISSVTGTTFGYPGSPDLQADTWPQAFGKMLAAVFDDAVRFGVDPPIEPLRARFTALLPLLTVVERPSLIHFDLWDGNILVKQGEAGWAVTGLIDWERAFQGDPLAELVSLSFHTERMALDPDVLESWSEATGIVADGAGLGRLALYRAYLWLIMLTEAGPRGFRVTQPAEKWVAVRRRLDQDLALAEG